MSCISLSNSVMDSMAVVRIVMGSALIFVSHLFSNQGYKVNFENNFHGLLPTDILRVHIHTGTVNTYI